MKKLVFVLCMLVLMGVFVACGESQSKETGGTSAESVEEVTEERVIFDNEHVTVIYKGVEESYGIPVMLVKMENKTDGEITVVAMDSSVDDVMVMFGSGMPGTMQPGKSINHAFTIGQALPTNNIEMKLSVMDGSWSEISRSDVIRIEY